MKRRDFFKNMFGVAGLLAAAPVLFNTVNAQAAERKKKDAGPEMVSPNDPTAKGVKYIETSAMKDKTCANCVLFNKTGAKDGKDIGTCAIFPGKFVYAKAHCTTWAKKA